MEAQYTVCATPIGDAYVAWTTRGIAYLSTAVASADEFLARVRSRCGYTPQRGDERREELTSVLLDWLDGRPHHASLDLGALTAFTRAVLDATVAIPRGQVRTYGELATSIGHAGAARAVGNVMARNPVPLLVPCHRVVPSTGRIGNYGNGGREWKERLLRMEGVDLKRLRVLHKESQARSHSSPTSG